MTSKGMKCVFLLAEHMDEQDAKTALYPFSKLFKNSAMMTTIKEKYLPNFESYGLCFSLERCMERGHYDIVVFLIESVVNFRSKSTLERTYHHALRTGAPDSLVTTLENLLIDS